MGIVDREQGVADVVFPDDPLVIVRPAVLSLSDGIEVAFVEAEFVDAGEVVVVEIQVIVLVDVAIMIGIISVAVGDRPVHVLGVGVDGHGGGGVVVVRVAEGVQQAAVFVDGG